MEPKNAMAEPDILGTARKAELFDELLKTFEEFMEDEDVYEILRSMMTDQEIIKSGFPFKHNDAEQQALAVLEQLGGQAEPGIPANTAKLRDLLRIHLPDEAYLEHRSTAVDLLSIGDIVKMKKAHPCGSRIWTVLRVGMDIKLRCTGCGHELMLPRSKAEKAIKKILTEEGSK